MNFTNLRYFLTTTQYTSITQAAKALYLTQQSLSNLINRLEKEYNTKLFIRKPKLQLTEAGECLKAFAIQVLELEEDFNNQINDIEVQCFGNISIGIGWARARKILSKILPEFNKKYPNIKIYIVQGSSVEIQEQLISGSIDIYIGRRRNILCDAEIIKLFNVEQGIIITEDILRELFPKDYPEKAKVFQSGADISFFSEAPFLMYSNKSSMRSIIDSFFYEQNIIPNIVLEADDPDVLLRLAELGMGITIVGKSFDESRILPMSYFFPLNYPSLADEIVIAYKKDKYTRNTTKNFIKTSLDTISKIESK